MGPADFLNLLDGYYWRQRHQNNLAERELYLLRRLVQTVHNALAKKSQQIRDPAKILELSFDRQQKTQRKRKLRRASSELFRRAKKRGSIQ